MPVKYRYWQQHELWDGTYTVGDWLDIIEQIPEFNREKTLFLEAIMDKIS